MCTQKMRALSYIGAEKITFPPKPDIHTDSHTYRWTDISVYRVASLLKMYRECLAFVRFRVVLQVKALTLGAKNTIRGPGVQC